MPIEIWGALIEVTGALGVAVLSYMMTRSPLSNELDEARRRESEGNARLNELREKEIRANANECRSPQMEDVGRMMAQVSRDGALVIERARSP